MSLNYIFSFGVFTLCSALLRRIAKRPEESIEVQEDWSRLPDDVYLSDALYSRMGGRA